MIPASRVRRDALSVRGRIGRNLRIGKIIIDSDWMSELPVEFHAKRSAIDTSPIAAPSESVRRASEEFLKRPITTGDMKRSNLPWAWSRWLFRENNRRRQPVVGAE